MGAKKTIPFTSSGKLAFEQVKKVADRLQDTARQALGDYIAATYTAIDYVTLEEWYDRAGKHCQKIKTNSTIVALAYDYRNGTIAEVEA